MKNHRVAYKKKCVQKQQTGQRLCASMSWDKIRFQVHDSRLTVKFDTKVVFLRIWKVYSLEHLGMSYSCLG